MASLHGPTLTSRCRCVNYDDPFGLCPGESSKQEQANRTQSGVEPCASPRAATKEKLAAAGRMANAVLGTNSLMRVGPVPAGQVATFAGHVTARFITSTDVALTRNQVTGGVTLGVRGNVLIDNLPNYPAYLPNPMLTQGAIDVPSGIFSAQGDIAFANFHLNGNLQTGAVGGTIGPFAVHFILPP
jgi:hypothetical protein